MHSVTVALTITSDEYLKAYQGAGKIVMAKDAEGRNVRFPASILRPFVTHSGIHGVFLIEFGDAGKFRRISRLR